MATKTTRKTTRKATKKVAKKATKKATKKIAKKASTRKAAPKSARKPAPKAAERKSREKSATKKSPISPKQALANTRKLLQAKRAHDRQGQPWQTLDPEQSHVPEAGYQSAHAAATALDLHAGESRMAPIEGSISTRARKDQGKRDKR